MAIIYGMDACWIFPRENVQMTVIPIQFHIDLPTKAQNDLRYRLELANWRTRWRAAKARKDYDMMDRLDREFEWLGLP